jgi:DNA replication ATP-dependent helicase Dna2
VSPLFEDPLSDQIPSERAHEIWSRAGGARPWNQQLRQLEETVRVRLSAIESVVQRLGDDLQGQLNRTAPRIQHLRPPSLPQRMADDARLWFIFMKLNVALQELEIQKLHAMPPHEREARFKSAYLIRRLSSAAASPVLTQFGLTPLTYRHVYELHPRSSEVRAREGDFTFALSPSVQAGFLSERLRRVAGQTPLPLRSDQNEWTAMQWVTQVTIRAIDRDQRMIVLDFDPAWWPVVQALQNAQVLDLNQDVMLDPVHRDFLVDRLEDTLNAIGNPPAAIANAIPNVVRATGSTRRPTHGTPSSAGDLYWNATQLYHEHVQRILPGVRQLLRQHGYDLNHSQWLAWEESLTHRLRLIWGPPGTGKSRTLRTIILGALHEAALQGRNLRVLITGPTYEAIDNVLLEVYATLSGTSPLALPTVHTARLRSPTQPVDQRVPQGIDVATSGSAFQQLQDRLRQHQGLTLVGATAQQAHRLLIAAGGAATELFDLILVDEASQLDVATSTLPLAGLAAGGSVIIAGDPKQLPPIHQAEAPLDLDHVVGPVFTYFTERFQLQPCVLEVNYRSCRTIVELAYAAHYPRTVHAYSPDMRLDLLTALPTAVSPPAQWPANLFWTPEWASLLSPDEHTVCFIYPEGRSSQWNHFEADAVASLVWLLSSRIGNQLQNELDTTGAVRPTTGQAYTMQEFWSQAVGIVTPHRAQQALIVSRLQTIFPGIAGQGIREAVDTVERFQGQERDIMLATFALGDPDAISDEDEFLLSLNRFNVMTSRARAKLIVFVSQEVVDHLSSDMQVLRDSALLKTFAETLCSQARAMQLGYIRNGTPQSIDGVFRWRP